MLEKKTASTRSIIRIAAIVLCSSFCIRGAYYSCSEGFSLRRIETPLSLSNDLQIAPPKTSTLDQLKTVTSQPFHYLTKGSQAYAFESEDGQYIIKLFKLHHLQSASWLKSIPTFGFIRAYRDSLIERRDYRINLTLTSYKLAADLLSKECGLLYAQILPTSSYSLPVTIKDAIGRTYNIDLAQHGYAIQKKSKLVCPSFDEWIATGETQKAKKGIDSLVSLIVRRSLKGIQDTDPDLHKNAGLLNETAMFIDIGSFHRNPKIAQNDEMKRDIKKVFSRFSSWLKKRSPELYDHLQNRLENPSAEYPEPTSA